MAAKIPPGRREADQLLLVLLRQNGCSIPKGVTSVGQLSSDAVIEAVGSLVPGIDGSPPLPEARSTRGYHPADRHRVCLAVASRVREAGYSEPLSAHQLLYPAEGSTRQLLLALLNMLPPDGAPPPPPAPSSSVSGNQIPPMPGASEEQGSDLLSGELPKAGDDSAGVGGVEGVLASEDSETQQPGEQGSVQSDGTENMADAMLKDSPEIVEEEQASSNEEPGKSRDTRDTEDTGENGIQPSKQRATDEEGEGNREDDGEDKRNGNNEEPGKSCDTEGTGFDGIQPSKERATDEEGEGNREGDSEDKRNGNNEEPGKSRDTEGTGDNGIQPSKERATDEEGEGITEGDGEDKRNGNNEEPGKSRDTEGTGDNGIQPSKERATDEEGEGNREGDGEDKRNGNENREVQDALTGTSGEDEAAEPGDHMGAVEPLSGESTSADTGVGDAAAGQQDEPEKGGGFTPDNRRLEQQQHGEDEEEHEFGGDARLVDEAVVDEGVETIEGRETDETQVTQVSVVAEERVDTEERVEESYAGLLKEQAIDGAEDREEQRVASMPDGKEAGPVDREKNSDPEEDPESEHDPQEERDEGKGVGVSPSDLREKRNGETPTALDSASTLSNAEAERSTRDESSGESCDAAPKTEGKAAGEDPGEEEDLVPRGLDPKDEEIVRPVQEEEVGVGEEESETLPKVEVKAAAPLAEGVEEESRENSSEDDVIFLQFEVDAQEMELNRLLGEEAIASKAADKLEEEVHSLSALAEERETHCRYVAKALELLPNAADETSRLQREITAAESRIQADQKSFGKTMKPLEEMVRAQREELARRKARCRDLLSEIRSKYDESEEMSGQESLLRASARDMERWERHKRGDIVIGGEEGEDNQDDGWGEGLVDEDWEEARRRNAGASLRADIDARIARLCDEALAQKQDIVISLSELLDSRREANTAWDLLGRAEALAEEKLFSAAKEAVPSNKDRARDLIEAYKRLYVLDGVFSSLVEAVSGLTKREEECQLVEDETARMLSQHGGSSVMFLIRDLKRVREDAFALEQMLDELLEEQRLQQKARQEAERLESEREAAEEQATDEVIAEGVEEIEEGLVGAASPEQGVHFGPEPAEERQEEANAKKGLGQEEHFDESGAAGFDDGAGNEGRSDEDEVDFIGDEEEDNVWQ